MYVLIVQCTVGTYFTYYLYSQYNSSSTTNCVVMHGAGRVADAHCCILYVMYVAVLTIALLVKGHLSLHGSRTVSVSQQRHSSSSSRLHSKTGTSDVVDVKPVKVCHLWRCCNMHPSNECCMNVAYYCQLSVLLSYYHSTIDPTERHEVSTATTLRAGGVRTMPRYYIALHWCHHYD